MNAIILSVAIFVAGVLANIAVHYRRRWAEGVTLFALIFSMCRIYDWTYAWTASLEKHEQSCGSVDPTKDPNTADLCDAKFTRTWQVTTTNNQQGVLL